jgi:hypothetical protein
MADFAPASSRTISVVEAVAMGGLQLMLQDYINVLHFAASRSSCVYADYCNYLEHLSRGHPWSIQGDSCTDLFSDKSATAVTAVDLRVLLFSALVSDVALVTLALLTRVVGLLGAVTVTTIVGAGPTATAARSQVMVLESSLQDQLPAATPSKA